MQGKLLNLHLILKLKLQNLLVSGRFKLNLHHYDRANLGRSLFAFPRSQVKCGLRSRFRENIGRKGAKKLPLHH